MALYDLFTKIVGVFSQLKPERIQTALTALSQALHGRGATIGATIDHASAASAALTPSLIRFLDTTPQFRDVMQALSAATPDVIETLSAATTVSNRMAADRAGIAGSLDALAGIGSMLTPVLADNREDLITIVDSVGKILATTAVNPTGLVDTLAGVRAFGEAGGRVFSTGKFNITAVATFAGPMPYNATDCPVYGATYGAHCADSDQYHPVPGAPPDPTVPRSDSHGPPSLPAWAPYAPVPAPWPGPVDTSPKLGSVPPQLGPQPVPLPTDTAPPAGPLLPAETAPASAVVGGTPEAHALAVLEGELSGASVGQPNIATVLMLGPIVRGTEVRIS